MKKLILLAIVAVNVFAFDECNYNLNALNEEMQKGIISAKEFDKVSERYYVDMALIYNTNCLIKCNKSLHPTILNTRRILNDRKEFLK